MVGQTRRRKAAAKHGRRLPRDTTTLSLNYGRVTALCHCFGQRVCLVQALRSSQTKLAIFSPFSLSNSREGQQHAHCNNLHQVHLYKTSP